MKMSPAILLLIASALTSQVALSADASNSVTRAIWKCKGAGNVSAMIITVNPAANTSSGEIYDASMSSEGISISADDSAYLLSGGIYGHDQRGYNVELLPSSGSAGTATVSYSGFIDCVGDVSGVEKLSCEVETERK
ncbi:MAG: hypothetical protein ACJ763_02365 [Bdellovibrionia bacterium]